MGTENSELNSDIKKIFALLSRLESRVAALERSAATTIEEKSTSPYPQEELNSREHVVEKKSTAADSLEYKIGEFWLAQVGSVVLLLGLAFLISYPFKTLPPILITTIGYVSVALVLGLSKYWKKNFQYLSRILFGGGLFLLYFTTLRLHFFTANPLITSKSVGIVAVVVVLLVLLYVVNKQKNEMLAGMVIFLCLSTALISDAGHFTLATIAVSSVLVSYFVIRNNWNSLFVTGLVMTYLAHLIWLFNTPVLGRALQFVPEHHFNLFYSFVYVACFSCANLWRDKSSYSDFFEISLATVNGFGFLLLNTLVIIKYFEAQIPFYFLLSAAMLLAIAVLRWMYHGSKYASAMYACLGFMALSIAIFSEFNRPDYFVWLSWQSLLVMSTALWFRSRIIIVVNIFIYLGIFLAYLQFATSNSFVNVSYALVALISARILNWQKDRLKLKTDLIRNAYLVSTFIIVLYGLYHAVPENYISLSWLGAAIFYFLMSVILHNIKYRWMAILTILAMLVYVFFIDMSRLGAGYRILLFVATGIILLIVSFIYARHKKKLFTT